MARVATNRWESFERWSPALFLLAGASLLVVLAVTTFEQVTGTAIPDIAYWPLFPSSIAAALAGLVGFYPRLVEQVPRPAKVGLGLALSGGVLLLGGLAVLFMTAPPGSYPGSLGPLGAPFLLGLVLFVPAFGVYGVAGLRTATLSRRVSSLLLAAAVVQLGELAGALFVFPATAARTSAQTGWFLIFEVLTYGAIIAALVGIGHALQTDALAAEHEVEERDWMKV
ncbi:MAG: hypothetical protein ABEJ05_09255 [Haloglomus sp.]